MERLIYVFMHESSTAFDALNRLSSFTTFDKKRKNNACAIIDTAQVSSSCRLQLVKHECAHNGNLSTAL
jgi:hypothetical protein